MVPLGPASIPCLGSFRHGPKSGNRLSTWNIRRDGNPAPRRRAMEHVGEDTALDPSNLARAYERYVSAIYRGEDEEANSFAVWLEGHWTGEAPSEPSNPPDSENSLGPGGAGIHWYAGDGVVLGYVTSRSAGCYRVRAGESVPIVRAPWEEPAATRRGAREGIRHGNPER